MVPVAPNLMRALNTSNSFIEFKKKSEKLHKQSNLTLDSDKDRNFDLK